MEKAIRIKVQVNWINPIEIKTITEAIDYADSIQRLYEAECAAHAETLRLLEIERMLADDFADWWQRQQD